MNYQVYVQHNGHYKNYVEIKTFADFNALFSFIKEKSCNFIDNVDIPIKHNPKDIEYVFMKCIKFSDRTNADFPDIEIHRIDISVEDGDFCVFSDGKYTNSRKFCSKNVQAKLVDMQNKIKRIDFIED